MESIEKIQAGKWAGESEKLSNASRALFGEGEKEKEIENDRNGHAEAKKKEDRNLEIGSGSGALKDGSVVETRWENLLAKPEEEVVKVKSSKNYGGRSKRRPVTRRTTTATSNASEMPSMSPERRNSYLSIAERRKYYNRMHERARKPETVDGELENQETVKHFVTSSISETLQTNEIPVSKRPAVKNSSRTAVEKKIQPNKIVLQNNEKQKRIQNTRQSVLQSQLEFGQKLNMRKTLIRTPENRNENSKRNKESGKTETASENGTSKFVRNQPTQSTKLFNLNKNDWTKTTTTTTTTSTTNEEQELNGKENDFVAHQNKTDILKMVEYVTINRTRGTTNAFSNSTSFVDNRATENNGREKLAELRAVVNVTQLPHKNSSVDGEEAKDDILKIHNQEILRVNPTTTRKSLRVPMSVLKLFSNESKENQTKVSVAVGDSVSVVAPVPTGETHPESTRTSGTRNTTNPVELIGSGTSRKSSEKTSGHRVAGPMNPPTPIEVATIEVVTPSVDVKPIPILGRDGDNPITEILPRRPNSSQVEIESKGERENSTSTSPPSSKFVRDYPLTIELNENNKRLLSEMFQTQKTTESATRPTTSIPNYLEIGTGDEKATYEPETTTTTTTTPSLISSLGDPKIVSMDDFQEEDRSPSGTRYNTKFYVFPNVSRTRQKVIKVMEDDDDEEDEEGGGASVSRPFATVAYVLAAFGIVPLVLAAVFAAKFFIHRRQRRYECETDEKSDSVSTGECQMRQGKKKSSTDLKKTPSNVTTTTLVTASRLPRVHQHRENSEKQGTKNWEFSRSKLRMKTILGQGNFGQVWKAEVDDLPGHEGKTLLVAVKGVKEGATEKEQKEFLKELEIMQQIGSHPNIVTLLGCCTDQEPHYLIMEYVKYGKLLTYLREHRVNENYNNFSNNADALTSKDLTVFAYCISRGMEYLASKGIIHRDLAARNVLVDHNKVCKIADFGMSRSVRNFEDGQVFEERQHKGALPIRWMAPESLVYSVFTYKSDVWSFGVVMWEIVTLGSTPYPNMEAREIMRKVRDGYRLERPSHCKPEFYKLMSSCWCHDPNKRPDFSKLRQDLSNLLENPSKNGSYVDLDRFAADNGFHVSVKSNHLRLVERKVERPLKRFRDWEIVDWTEEPKTKGKTKKSKNNGKGTVTLTGQGSFTVNSRILEKEFKMI